ncbi:MAG: histidine--tRNA ligase [Candidatus Omnitrophota bacterium]
MKKTYSGVRGTTDFAPPAAALFSEICVRARAIGNLFGYEEIILPVLEEEGVFSRGVGQTSDIVEKQMFRLARRSEEASGDIVLRPEGTAQVVRFYLENALNKQSDFYKFFYIGPMFRGERPQKGRLRQFHHIGAEAIGSDSVHLDAEMIMLAFAILEAAGVRDKELVVNTLGCAADKERFSQALTNDLRTHQAALCPDCGRRLSKNPLRVLDCKQDQCKRLVSTLGLSDKHLCEDCKRQFKLLRELLDALAIPYRHNPHLVRGLDYYTNTVFEITSKRLGAQDAIGAGGRYNNLISQLGGPDVPALGFALGLERVILAREASQDARGFDVFVVSIGEAVRGKGFSLLGAVRAAGIAADMDYCAKSLKAQMRCATRRGARFVVIIGEEEQRENVVVIKNMEASTQEKVSQDDFVEFLRQRITVTPRSVL